MKDLRTEESGHIELMQLERDIQRQVIIPPHTDARAVAEAVLCVLSQRLSGGEARRLVEALPQPLESAIKPCALHGERAVRLDRDEVLERIGQHLEVSSEEAASLSRGVFAAMCAQLSADQIAHIRGQLPEDLEWLWRGTDEPRPGLSEAF